MTKKFSTVLIIALMAVFLCSLTFRSDAETISEDAGSWSYTIDDSGMMTISNCDNPSQSEPDLSWKRFADRITGIQFSETVVAPRSLGIDFLDLDTESWITESYFSDLKNLKTVDFTNFDVSNTWSYRHLFSGCESLESVDMSMFSWSDSIVLNSMFKNCSNLKEVVFPEMYPEDLQGAEDIFNGCSNLEKVYFGRKDATTDPSEYTDQGYSTFHIALPTPNPQKFSGRWINTNTGEALYPTEWRGHYSVYPEGTYIAEKRKLNVKFDTRGGSKVDSQVMDYGAKAEEPEVPTREGFKFEGWYFKGKKFTFDTPITEPTTLFARWSKEAKEKYILRYPDGSTKTTNDYAEAQRLLDQWELLASDLETDENGNIILEDWMKGGNVRIEETKVPKGYKEKTVVVETSIDANGVEVVNEKVKGAHEDEGEEKKETKGANTSDSSNILVYILTALFGTALLTILMLRRRIETRKLMTILLVLGIAASIVYALPQNANAKTDSIDSFKIDKIDQYREPVWGAVFSIYGKPILETEKDKTEIPVRKVWDDDNNSGQFRPSSVTVNLMANDKKVDSVKLSDSNGWEHTFKDLAESDENGPIDYYVEEEEQDRYYGTVEYKDGAFVITNKPKVPLTISKSSTRWFADEIGSLKLSIIDEDGKTISTWEFDSSYASNYDEAPKYYSKSFYLKPGKYSFREEVEPRLYECQTYDEALDLNFRLKNVRHMWQETDIIVNEDGSFDLSLGNVYEDVYIGYIERISEEKYIYTYSKSGRALTGGPPLIREDDELTILIDNHWFEQWK